MAKSLFDLTLEEYKRTVEINQVSVFLGMKAVAPSMKKQVAVQSLTSLQ